MSVLRTYIAGFLVTTKIHNYVAKKGSGADCLIIRTELF